jgi:hypothetical protein
MKLYILELSNNIQRSSDLFSSKLRDRLLSSISPMFVTFVLAATHNNGARFIMVLYHVLTKYVIRTLHFKLSNKYCDVLLLFSEVFQLLKYFCECKCLEVDIFFKNHV